MMTLLAQGMAIVTIAAPALILLVVGVALAGRFVLRRLKRNPGGAGAATEVLISEEGWGKQIHRASSAAPSAKAPDPVTQPREAPAPALDLSAVGEEEPERRRA